MTDEAGYRCDSCGEEIVVPMTGERLGLLATAAGGEAGRVDLPEPIVVRAGEAFIAVPQRAAWK
jgi:hypothetical protein